jgi:hypothetical protein
MLRLAIICRRDAAPAVQRGRGARHRRANGNDVISEMKKYESISNRKKAKHQRNSNENNNNGASNGVAMA